MSQTAPVRSTGEAIRLIEAFEGNPKDFVLSIHESLLDPVGVNMALITDHILARGWQPDGFVQQQGHRLYRYTELC